MNDDISILTLALAKKYTDEHGGGGGTTDYDDLSNKPQIAGITLSGNKSLADLGIASATDLADKVDKVAGKVLSTNDYTDADKTIVAGVTTALAGKQDTLTFDDTPTDNSNNPVKSNGIYDALALKQNATDNSLDTTAKTIVGAINEHEGDVESLMSGLTTIDNEVNGDAVEYPYADVITIEDAVPANLADCSVKIEPIQDLHGQSAPYVGGAGKNKENITLTTGTYAGVAWTVYDDKRIKISGTVPSGGVTLNTAIADIDTTALAGYKFVYSTDGSGNIYPRIMNSDLSVNLQDLQNGTIIADNGSNCKLVYRIPNNTSIDKTISSMIVASTETDLSYAPYTNICPITGHTEASVQRDGKNLFDKNSADIQPWYIGGTDHKIGFNANTRSIIIPCNPSTTYTISKTAGTTLRAASIESASYAEFTQTAGYIANNTGSSLTITTTTNAQYLITTVRGSDDTVSVDDMINSVQFELGSSATDYEPFRGKTYTIALGDTIYGGTVDFDSGVMTVTHGYCKVPSNVEWTYKDTYGGFFFSEGSTYAPGLKANSVNISNMLETVTDISTFEGKANAIYTVSELNFKVSGINTVSDFETWLDNNDLYVCYELATPTTTQLTPQQIQLLKGTNTLTASTGQISVTVNGVSGAIGAVQEQVNDIAEDVAEIKLLNYSTTEQKTGQKWLDGKDIYFRVWDFGENVSVTSNDYYTGFNIDSSSMDKVLSGAIMNDDGTLYVNASYDPTKVNHTLLGIKPVNNCNVRYLTLYYTKTT